MLTTTGARSGLPRTVPVLGLPTADGLAVIASNYGQRSHPAWYYNLRADPHRRGRLRRQHPPLPRRRGGAAPNGSGSGSRACSVYPGWSQYERRASERRIAVFVLTPA